MVKFQVLRVLALKKTLERLSFAAAGNHRVSLHEAQLTHSSSGRRLSSIRSAEGQQAANNILHVGKPEKLSQQPSFNSQGALRSPSLRLDGTLIRFGCRARLASTVGERWGREASRDACDLV